MNVFLYVSSFLYFCCILFFKDCDAFFWGCFFLRPKKIIFPDVSSTKYCFRTPVLSFLYGWQLFKIPSAEGGGGGGRFCNLFLKKWGAFKLCFLWSVLKVSHFGGQCLLLVLSASIRIRDFFGVLIYFFKFLMKHMSPFLFFLWLDANLYNVQWTWKKSFCYVWIMERTEKLFSFWF